MPPDSNGITWDAPDPKGIVWDDAPTGHKPMGWGDVASSALSHTPSSAMDLVKNIYNTLRHPVDTVSGIGSVVAGLPEAGARAANSALGLTDNTPVSANESATDAVGRFYKDRYGSMEGFKNALATDPVGVMADASVVASGAPGVARMAGLTKAAQTAETLRAASNPVHLVAKSAEGIGRGTGYLTSEGLGATTGTSGQTIRTAFDAGQAGGPAADAFTSHLNGSAPIEEIVSDAKRAVTNLRRAKSEDYTVGMGPTKADNTVLSLEPIDQAIAKTMDVNNYKGLDTTPETAAVRKQIMDAVDLWRNQNPEDFHTAEGLDALKRRIGSIRDNIPFDRRGDRLVANSAYDAVRGQIAAQSPTYAKTMADYGSSSKEIEDIEKTLSLTPTANVDTSVRKLQSALRDNVNTSYGRRADLANILAESGAPQLMDKIAGQQLSSPMPRGLGNTLAGGEIGGAMATAVAGHPGVAAAMIPTLALSSPRLVGSLAFQAGRGSKLAKLLAEKIGPRDKEAVIASQLSAMQGNKNNPQNAAELGRLLSQIQK